MTGEARTGHTATGMLDSVMPAQLPRLREARAMAGLTQAALADLVGVEQPHIARWESGAQLPRVDRAVGLACALATTVEAIWPGEPPPRSGDCR